jgi:hypothetical protein
MQLHSVSVLLLASQALVAADWPLQRQDLQVLFGRFDATDAVRLPSGEDYQTYLPMAGRVWRTPDARLDCAGGSWRCSQDGVAAFVERAVAKGRCSIGLRYESLAAPSREGVLLSAAPENGAPLLELVQQQAQLLLRLRSSTKSEPQTVALGAAGDAPAYLQLAYDSAATPRLRAWRDGRPLALAQQPPASLTTGWTPVTVHLGNDAAGTRPWHGRLDALTMGSGTLDDAGAAAEAAALAQRFPAPLPPGAPVVVRARLLGGAEDGEEEAQQYTRSIYSYTFEVEAVLSGSLDAKRVAVRRLARMDRAMDPTVVGLPPGTVQTLYLRPWSEFLPAFEAETIYTLDGDDQLPGFFEVSRR